MTTNDLEEKAMTDREKLIGTGLGLLCEWLFRKGDNDGK